MKRKAYSRGERQSQILDKFYSLVDKSQTPELTIYQLAKMMDMTPSPHLRKMVWELVSEGTLDSRTAQHRTNTTKTIFFVPPDQYSFPKKSERMIMLNGNQMSFA